MDCKALLAWLNCLEEFRKEVNLPASYTRTGAAAITQEHNTVPGLRSRVVFSNPVV